MQMVMDSKATDGGTYHIGTSVETNIGELIEEMFKVAGWHPKKVEPKAGPEGSVKRRLPDVSKIKRDTGWVAKTRLSEGLQKTLNWQSGQSA